MEGKAVKKGRQSSPMSVSLSAACLMAFSSLVHHLQRQTFVSRYELLVEGTDLRSVMGTQGVVGTKTTTNHVLEAASCLGIEAARTTIMREIKYTMGQHGMAIDDRHTMLLADCMTFKVDIDTSSSQCFSRRSGHIP